MTTVISVENLSKSYRLGQIGTGTFAHDLNVWWARLRGKPNPMRKIGQSDQENLSGEELWALKEVSFTVEQGEVLGIIGRNGAGKSTLLKILSRVTAPTSGKIKVKGRVASLLEVGTGFHPELTGRENIYLNGAILGMTRQEVTRKFDEIVDFAGVEKFIDTPVKRYSSGMYVRLAFAVAAHLEPEILVVDEVLAVGDAEFQKKCLGKMGEVAQEGRTVLFVSHNMDAVASLCNRVCWVNNGTIQSSGNTRDVINQYLVISDVVAFCDLRNHPNRRKNSSNFLLSAYLKKDGIESSTFEFGDTLSLDICYEYNVGDAIHIGFSISDINRHILFATNTLQNGIFLEAKIGVNIANVLVDSMPFSPGRYSISLFLGNGKFDLDVIDYAMSFNIVWNAQKMKVPPPYSSWGPVYLPVKWLL